MLPALQVIVGATLVVALVLVDARIYLWGLLYFVSKKGGQKGRPYKYKPAFSDVITIIIRKLGKE